MSGVNEVRSTFLSYLAKHGHTILPSSSLVPNNDPTLMFTNAGMVQFKNIFTGVEKSVTPRATTSQKCVRAGGKHNDLDNVGYTARHHTFFEMLGNFSFGDYFKEHAIELAWNLITKDYALSPSRLLVTVYSEDEEAAGLWRKIAGLPDSKIIRIPTSDNFWAMGDTGPCGPCSEIFFDHGDHVPGGPPGSADEDGDRFIEIWNLVFMQYEQGVDGRVALPKPSIDTGMGLERMSAVLQGTHDNYSIDLFRALISTVEALTNVPSDGPQKASHRVIADHLRASAFLVADGVLPSNEGRGYVLRRIMRRAMRHAQLLGAQDPVLWRLVPVFIREMGVAFPELLRAEALITETLKLEETRFRKTLERGLGILEEETSTLRKGDLLSGQTAFTLYDTYGFPLDLTEDALKARGIGVDRSAFDQAMQGQREKARAAWSGSGDAATDNLWFSLKERVGTTEFLGYDSEQAEGVVTALVRDGQEVSLLTKGETGLVLVNQTPFYAESGGQVGDQGFIKGAQFLARVTQTEKKLGDVFLHHIVVEEGSLKTGDAIELKVDVQRRQSIRANHSATHILHEALRQVLGDHVAQKGSLVASDKLRFDFSHPKPLTSQELDAVSALSNQVVLQNEPVITRLMAVNDAIESGARALFGEKYGDEVRVVSMGLSKDSQGQNLAFSVELCGGTHARRTGDIGQVLVLGDSAVASGVRRLEAITGEAARIHAKTESDTLSQVSQLLKTTVQDAPQRITLLLDEKRRLERELSDIKRRLALSGGGSGDAAQEDAKQINGVHFLGRIMPGLDMKDMKGLVDDAKKRIGSGIVVLITVSDDGKAGIVAGVTSDLCDRYNSVQMVRLGSEILGGKGGGGRADLAQAGGPDGAKAQEALQAIEQMI